MGSTADQGKIMGIWMICLMAQTQEKDQISVTIPTQGKDQNMEMKWTLAQEKVQVLEMIRLMDQAQEKVQVLEMISLMAQTQEKDQTSATFLTQGKDQNMEMKWNLVQER